MDISDDNESTLSDKKNFLVPMASRALLVAEKPDLMRKIEDVYNNNRASVFYNIDFTAQRGHLVTLLTPNEMDESLSEWTWENMPIEPENYGGWNYKVIQEKKVGNFLTAQERYNEIKRKIDSGNYDFIIHAGDPDQEGELLVNIVLQYAKNTLPVKRFWTNDLTESHILNALQNLKDENTDTMLINLMNAALARQHSDYRFGMNVSRAASLQMGGRVACGRVKTPILAIICRREEEIKNFKAQTEYGIKANYEVQDGSKEGFSGQMFIAGNMDEKEEDEDKKNGIVWYPDRDAAEDKIRDLSHFSSAEVVSYETEEEKTYAPKLFKLATLQIEAGKLGFNDGQTLKIIQSLYEKKLLSYPRTDCEYLSSDEDFYGILRAVMNVPEFNPYIRTISTSAIERVKNTKKWINDKALEDSGHSAIRPTTEKADFKSLSDEEQTIYSLVCRRFVAMFLPPLIQNKTKLITDINGNTFVSHGKTLVDPGYTVIFGTKFTDMIIPVVSQGQFINVNGYDIAEKTSKCPKRYTSPDIIAVCENPAKFLEDKSLKVLGKRLKIGTPATRSGIIEQLIKKDHYLEEKKVGKRVVLVPTAMGAAIIKNLGPCDICKVDLTGEWEEKLEDVRTGKKSLETLENEMRAHVVAMIEDIKRTPMTPFVKKSSTKVVGICPECGNEIIESQYGFSCRGYKKDGTGCNIKLWKNKWNATFTVDDFYDLIKDKKIIEKEITVSLKTWVQPIKYNFDACDVEYVEAEGKTICDCPHCNGRIVATEHTFKCENGDLNVSRAVCGCDLSDFQFDELVKGEILTIMCKKDDKSWPQKINYNVQTKRIEFYRETTDYKCPCCHKEELYSTDKSLKCPDCGFTLWKTVASVELSDAQIGQLISEGKTDKIDGFKKKDGTKFKSAVALIVNKRKKAVEFDFPKSSGSVKYKKRG